MKKYCVLLFLLMSVACASFSFANDTTVPSDESIMAKQDNTTIITVNNINIPKWMYDNAFRDAMHGAKQSSKTVDTVAIQKALALNLIEMEVLYQEAQKQGCAINEAGGALRSKIIGGRFKDVYEFKRCLADAGMTEQQFGAIWQQQASVNALVDTHVLSKVSITEEELHARYEQDKNKYPRMHPKEGQEPFASFNEISDQLAQVMLQERGAAVFEAYKNALVKQATIVFHNAELEKAYAK